MATSIKHRGWKLDADQSYLAALFNGTEVYRITASAWSSTLPLSLTNAGTALNITTSVSTADNIVEILGTSTATTGTVRSLWAKLTATGASLTQARVISTTLTIENTTDYAYGYYAYTAAVSNKTIQQMADVYIYMEDMGNAVQHQVGLSINRNIATVGIATDCLLEMRNHGSTAATAFVKIVGSATYLWDFDQGDQVLPIDAWSSGTTVSHRAAVRMADGATRYLHIFTS